MLSLLENVPNIGQYPLTHVFETRKLRNSGNALWLEFGVASGRTINYISSFTDAPVYGFDSFRGLPERWRDGFEVGAFDMQGNPPKVRTNVQLVIGRIETTLPPFLQEHTQPISFIHIDTDIYSAAIFILNAVADRLAPDCVIVFDELVNFPGFDGPDSELRAFHEWLQRYDVTWSWIGINGTVGGSGAYECQNAAIVVHSCRAK